MNIKKAKKEALEYFENSLRVSYNDCSDSMHDMDEAQARFDAFVDDSISVLDFLEKNCLGDCAKIYQAFYDKHLKDSEWHKCRDDLAFPTVMDLVIKFSLLEPKLKLDKKHLK